MKKQRDPLEDNLLSWDQLDLWDQLALSLLHPEMPEAELRLNLYYLGPPGDKGLLGSITASRLFKGEDGRLYI